MRRELEALAGNDGKGCAGKRAGLIGLMMCCVIALGSAEARNER